MLHLIKGPAGSGKTEALRAEIRRGAEEGRSGQLLLVPKQFTFETERALLKLLGPAAVKQIEIRSFSRLAQWRLQQDPETVGLRFPDAGVKAVLMREALEQLRGGLEIYANAGKSSATLASLVDFVREIKSCRLTYEELRSTLDDRSNELNSPLLEKKLQELLLIAETYDTLLARSYFDDDTALSQYAKLAERERPFAGKTVYLDGFRTFTGQEEYIVRLALLQADDVYVTVCTDETRLPKGGPFACMDRLEDRLRDLCKNDGVGVTQTVLPIPEGAFSASIAAVERSLYRRGDPVKVPDDGSVTILPCDTLEDECAAVAREIRRLLRTENYRCREIAVIERSEGRYKRAMIAALRRLDIPVFDDSRRPLAFEPLFVYMSALLECSANRLTREELFRYLKTGLASLNADETARLEKYALVWNVDGGAWSHDFTGHPAGFGAAFDERAEQTLAELNALRRRAVCPLLQLQKDCTDKTGLEIGRAVFAYLEQEKVADRLYAEYRAFADEGYPVDADRIRDSWKELTALLDETVALTADRPVSFKKWAETFRLLLETRSAGEIPQGLDEVTVGAADRIRTEQIRAVFLLGVNRGEFPLVSVHGGVLTDKDRRTLTKALDVHLNPPYVDTLDEERFIAYCAVTAGAEKLCLSYRLSDGGAAAAPSELVDAVKNCVDGLQEREPLPLLDTVEGDDTAFAALASCYRGDSDDRATLLAYFADRPDYDGKLRALEAICGDAVFGFRDPANAERLFGKDIRISATRVNDYYTCPFAYFVKHGLKAYPLDEAKLNAAEDGSVLHYVFERVLQELPQEEYLNADPDTIAATVHSCMDDYLNEKMGGLEGKTPRFVFLFRRLETVACSVLETMRKELKNDAFTPRAFELKIGAEAIPAYTLKLDEGSVTLIGSVDRVDTFAGAERTYLRVLDYKTGKKQFALSDLLDGINVQMVLYMMALLKSESAPYGGAVPAGVMYMPARQHYKEYAKTRHENEAKLEKMKRNARRMSGMILADGEEGAPSNAACADYLPADTFTAEDFALLSDRVDDEIRAMGNALHAGQVPVLPAAGKDQKPNSCSWCNYRVACGYEEGKPVRVLQRVSHGEALKNLRKGREETDGE